MVQRGEKVPVTVIVVQRGEKVPVPLSYCGAERREDNSDYELLWCGEERRYQWL